MSVTSPSLVATPGALALAREVLQIEAQAVAALTDRIDGAFSNAVDLLLACARPRRRQRRRQERTHRAQDRRHAGIDRNPVDVRARR